MTEGTRQRTREMEAVMQMLERVKDQIQARQDAMEASLATKIEASQAIIEASFTSKIEDSEQKIKTEMRRMETEFDTKLKMLKNEVEELKSGRKEERVLDPEEQRMIGTEAKSFIKFKTPSYDGKTSWSAYLRQFNAAASANRWSDKEKATMLIVSLRGEALDVLLSVPEECQEDFLYITEYLERRFGDKNLEKLHRTQFRTRKQNLGETLQQFSGDISRLVRLAYPTVPDDVLEHMAIDVFSDGVHDSELQQHLKLSKLETLGGTLARALEFEAVKKSIRQGQVRLRKADVERDDYDSECLTKTTCVCQRIAENAPFRGYKINRNSRCYNCGKPGHLWRKCPAPYNQDVLKKENQENSD